MELVLAVASPILTRCRFYEWDKHDKNAKQPYLIYLPEGKEHFFSPKTESDAVHGAVPLLKLAAVFDVWKPKDVRRPD